MVLFAQRRHTLLPMVRIRLPSSTRASHVLQAAQTVLSAHRTATLLATRLRHTSFHHLSHASDCALWVQRFNTLEVTLRSLRPSDVASSHRLNARAYLRPSQRDTILNSFSAWLLAVAYSSCHVDHAADIAPWVQRCTMRLDSFITRTVLTCCSYHVSHARPTIWVCQRRIALFSTYSLRLALAASPHCVCQVSNMSRTSCLVTAEIAASTRAHWPALSSIRSSALRASIVTSSSLAKAIHICILCMRQITLVALRCSRCFSPTYAVHLDMAGLIARLRHRRTILSAARASRL